MLLLFYILYLSTVFGKEEGTSPGTQYVEEMRALGSIDSMNTTERCQLQLRRLVAEKKLCYHVTYFYSYDCYQLEQMDLMHLLWLEREQGWPISLEQVEIQTIDAYIHNGLIGGLCAMKYRTHEIFPTICYVHYDIFWNMYRDGIMVPKVQSEGLAAWFRKKSCPSNLWLIKYNMTIIK